MANVQESIETIGARQRQRCRLLELPAELRMQIWEYSISGHHVAFYDQEGRLAYGVMDDVHMSTPGILLPDSLDNMDNDAFIDIDKHTSEVHRSALSGKNTCFSQRLLPRKVQLTALLKTCHLIYSEAIELLYTANVFVFLQNTSLQAFHAATATQHLNGIRSVHMHWQVPELTQRVPNLSAPGQSEACRRDSAAIIAAMPHLRQLSVFLQGKPNVYKAYQQLLEGMASGLAHPDFYVARVTPLSPYTAYESGAPEWLEELRSKSGRYGALRVCRSFFKRGWLWHKVNDLGQAPVYHFRVGTLFEPHPSFGEEGTIVRSYVVATRDTP